MKSRAGAPLAANFSISEWETEFFAAATSARFTAMMRSSTVKPSASC
jgi:hypothetical protein